jgi:Arc/MetJ family transcription regulator
MPTTKVVDTELFARAVELTGIKSESALMKEALKALIDRETVRRAASFGDRKPKGDSPKSRHFDEHIYDTD